MTARTAPNTVNLRQEIHLERNVGQDHTLGRGMTDTGVAQVIGQAQMEEDPLGRGGITIRAVVRRDAVDLEKIE